jgi:hypothetical protein
MCKFTVTNPENDCYWRLLDNAEYDIYVNTPNQYGYTAQEAIHSQCRVLASSKLLKTQKGVLMGCSQQYVLQWKSAKKGPLRMLTINKAHLNKHSMEELKNAHVAVTSRVLIDYGDILDILSNI